MANRQPNRLTWTKWNIPNMWTTRNSKTTQEDLWWSKDYSWQTSLDGISAEKDFKKEQTFLWWSANQSLLGSYCWALHWVGACPMPGVDKGIKIRIIIKDSLEFKLFAIQTIDGNETERRTYRWKNEHIHENTNILKISVCWNSKLNLPPTHLKWVKIVMWEEKRRNVTKFCNVGKKDTMKISGDIGIL